MKRAALLLASAMLAGCLEKVEPSSFSDQCMRAELFQQCLKALPAGPVSTHYNDWDEVVAACENAAYYQSIREKAQIKPECRP